MELLLDPVSQVKCCQPERHWVHTWSIIQRVSRVRTIALPIARSPQVWQKRSAIWHYMSWHEVLEPQYRVDSAWPPMHMHNLATHAVCARVQTRNATRVTL